MPASGVGALVCVCVCVCVCVGGGGVPASEVGTRGRVGGLLEGGFPWGRGGAQ